MRNSTEVKTPNYSKKQQEDRKARILPNGLPKYVRCYDNGGPEKENGTIDRYTVVFTGRYTHKTAGEHWYLGMNGAPFHPQGFGQHGSHHTQIDYPTYGHLGKKIKFTDLPEDCQKCVMQTYLYLWDFTDEDGKEI